MICKRCGRNFSKTEARAEFDRYNDASGWRYDKDTPGNLCADCAQDYYEEGWMWGEKTAKDGPPPEKAIDKFAKIQAEIWKLKKKGK